MAEAPRITVLAGANGSGKSSIQGAMLRESGADYFDPDEAAREILAANPGASVEQANSAAWHEGVRLLERAIAGRLDWTFETTLAGRTVTTLLERALSVGIEVWVWYVGIDGPDRNVARVAARVAHGGHAIPEETIRARCPATLGNLIRLLPSLTALRVYDNSAEADPCDGAEPRPVLVLHMEQGTVVETCALERAPEWTKPILELALQLAELEETAEILSDPTAVRAIQRGLADFKAGRTATLEEVRADLEKRKKARRR